MDPILCTEKRPFLRNLLKSAGTAGKFVESIALVRFAAAEMVARGAEHASCRALSCLRRDQFRDSPQIERRHVRPHLHVSLHRRNSRVS